MPNYQEIFFTPEVDDAEADWPSQGVGARSFCSLWLHITDVDLVVPSHTLKLFAL